MQAEEAVLGSVLKHPLALAAVLPFLKAHHFYAIRHQHIYAAMTALFDVRPQSTTTRLARS